MKTFVITGRLKDYVEEATLAILESNQSTHIRRVFQIDSFEFLTEIINQLRPLSPTILEQVKFVRHELTGEEVIYTYNEMYQCLLNNIEFRNVPIREELFYS